MHKQHIETVVISPSVISVLHLFHTPTLIFNDKAVLEQKRNYTLTAPSQNHKWSFWKEKWIVPVAFSLIRYRRTYIFRRLSVPFALEIENETSHSESMFELKLYFTLIYLVPPNGLSGSTVIGNQVNDHNKNNKIRYWPHLSVSINTFPPELFI